MREILFRGKHIHAIDSNSGLDGEWIYGYLCSDNYIYDIELGGEMLIIPETVGQYTGLTDKNGKKIFEGDILYEEDWEINIAVRFDDECGWLIYNDTLEEFINEITTKKKAIASFIIGNIHDNPELLNNNG